MKGLQDTGYLVAIRSSHVENIAKGQMKKFSDETLGIEVRESKIPHAGYGLFATQTFAKDSVLAVYSGNKMACGILRKAREERLESAYVMGGFGLRSVDAEKSLCSVIFLKNPESATDG